MSPKNQPAKRNRLDFVRPGTQRGDVALWKPLPPEYVTEFRDNPDGLDKGPIEVGRVLPGQRAKLEVSGCPFEFTVRVTRDEDGSPQVVDLRMRSPVELGDVAITNADLKAVSVATLAAEVLNPSIPGIEVVDDAAERTIARRPGRPTRLTDEFLRDVTRLARDAHRGGYDINSYVAAALQAEGAIEYRAESETVRGWRKAATARRRKSPEDDGFLRTGELRGKPGKGAGQ